MILFPSVPDGEPLTVSATLYRAYLACPEQALGRLRGEYPAESVPGFRGSLAHRIFARHLAEGPIPAEELVQACREEIGAALNPKLEALGLNKPSALAPILAEVGDLYARFKLFPTDGFRAAEVDIEKDVGGSVMSKLRWVSEMLPKNPVLVETPPPRTKEPVRASTTRTITCSEPGSEPGSKSIRTSWKKRRRPRRPMEAWTSSALKYSPG